VAHVLCTFLVLLATCVHFVVYVIEKIKNMQCIQTECMLCVEKDRKIGIIFSQSCGYFVPISQPLLQLQVNCTRCSLKLPMFDPLTL